MIKATELVTLPESQSGFYPTPPGLAEKILSGIDWMYIQYVLEPSAGKGDLAKAVREEAFKHLEYRGEPLKIDCVEIDPYLRQILKYEFSEEAMEPLNAEYSRLDNMRYEERTNAQHNRLSELRRKIEFFRSTQVRVVHDDFLTYHTYAKYDLCVMNPPFANGDKHLLRAMEIMRNGGKIVCLLNAETIRNPYTVTRRILVGKLRELDAEIEYVPDAFKDAERQTDVEIAIVRIAIPEPERRSEFYDRMKKAADRRIETDPELKELVTGNYLEQAVQMYRVEVDATTKLVEEYFALLPYIGSSLIDKKSSPILLLAMQEFDDKYFRYSHNSYMEAVRLKYWAALFHNRKFTGKLTSDLRDKYRAEVNRMADYEFSLFNIQQVYLDMQEAMAKGIEDAILDLFDTMTVKYAHWSECKTTVWLYNGWKTNKAHKIGPKVILPKNVHASYVCAGDFWVDSHKAYEALSDIEKALDYLNAQPLSDGYSLQSRLKWAEKERQNRNIELKYFDVTFFKKGTMHIKFHEDAMPIVQRLNIFGSQHHGWLPPNYGKSKYTDMTTEEKAVVDSFHGDGAEHSGEGAYAAVMANAAFYLAAPTKKLPALMAPENV